MHVFPVTQPGPQRPGLFLKLAMWWGPRPLAQIAAIAVLAAIVVAVGWTISANMARIGISPGFEFLRRSANFEIGEQAIAFQAGDTYFRALLVGFVNTLKVALLGCVLATILGVLLGVAALSGNLMLSGLVRAYIEVVRNTPLLLQLFFWISLAQALPPPRRAFEIAGTVFLSNRGIFLPGPVVEGAPVWLWLPLLAMLAAGSSLLFLRSRFGRFLPGNRTTLVAALVALFVLLVLTSGASVRLDVPQLAGFNIRGGYSLSPEFAALLIGLVVKFSASIAEIVRAGILSVKQGPWEAGRALGLSNGQILRLIVLPQALRVITPLTTSNYLDLTKDSSLAVAIGYPDLVSIANTTANTTGQAFEALTIIVLVYLTLNIAVSIAMNAYNTRVALRGGKPA